MDPKHRCQGNPELNNCSVYDFLTKHPGAADNTIDVESTSEGSAHACMYVRLFIRRI